MATIIYTHSILKSLKEENDRQIEQQNVERIVKEITTRIIIRSTVSDKRSYVYYCIPVNRILWEKLKYTI